MKGLGPRVRRFLWWGSLSVFVFCGAIIAYYLYTASVTAQTIGKVAGEISSLRNASEISNRQAAAFASTQTVVNPSAAPTAVWANAAASQIQSAILKSTPAPAAVDLTGANSDKKKFAEPKPTPENAGQDKVLAYYQNLAGENHDIIGWITIENTAVDYPVMYTPEEPEKYLHRDFEGRYSFAGLPFLDARCEPYIPQTNMIIYAHNMRSGQMFAEVTKYLDPDFLKAHPRVLFDTLTRRGVYEVAAVLQIDLKPLDDPSMLCYSLFDTAAKEGADELNEYITRYAVLKAGLIQAGDRILTLSTCKRIGSLDRLVIICRSPGDE